MVVFMFGMLLKFLKLKFICGFLDVVVMVMWVWFWDIENDFIRFFVKFNNLVNLFCVIEDDLLIRILILVLVEYIV